MTYKELKNKIKEEQKTLALQIRRGKYLRKPSHRVDITKDDKKLFYSNNDFHAWKIDQLSSEYRHKHIAYCLMFNNTPYHLIEQPQEQNKPYKSKLESYKKEWEGKIDETLRNSA
jgi:hypothetical protein